MKAKKPITTERILQLSNDLSEGIPNGSLRELRTVAAYWMTEHEKLNNEIMSIQTGVAGVCIGQEMMKVGTAELQAWLNKKQGARKK